MQRQEIGWMQRMSILCIDSYADGVPTGRLYSPNNESGCSFNSLSRLLIEMEHSLDELSFPQSFNAIRTFGPADNASALPEAGSQNTKGKLATFAIRVMFRQNASWQGSIRWLEGEREESFRSALEMIFLIDSVVDKAEKEQK